MYNVELKSKRIKAQLKELGGLGFLFRNFTKDLDEILLDDEDIYGYLLGFNKGKSRWEIILVTDIKIYVLDKDKMFTQGYSDYPIKAYKGTKVDSNLFNNFSVIVTIGKEEYTYKDCRKDNVSMFRTACDYAQYRKGMPYMFDKEPYIDGFSGEPKQVSSTNELFDYDDYDDSDGDNFEVSDDTSKDIYQDGNGTEPRNVFLYPTMKKGEGFHSYGEVKSEFRKQADYFKEVTGKEPHIDDFDFLADNEYYVKYFIDEKELSSFISFGRKGKLYLFKQEYGCKIFPSDYPTQEDYDRAMSLAHDEENHDRQELLLKSNHIANRFVDTYEPKEEFRVNHEETKDEEPVKDFGFDFDVNAILRENENEFESPNLEDLTVEKVEDSSEIKDTDGIVNNLRMYKQLLDEGILTQEEFDDKKREILNL